MSENRRRFNSNEQYDLKCLFAALTILERVGMESRIAEIPYAKRNFALVKSLTSKLCDALLHTMPSEQLYHLSRNVRDISYNIGVKRPACQTDNDYGIWLSYAAIDALIDSAGETCMLCNKTCKEQQSCPLRKGLNELPVKKINDVKGECPYYGRI